MKKVRSVIATCIATCLSFYLVGFTTLAAAANLWTLEWTDREKIPPSKDFTFNLSCSKSNPISGDLTFALDGVDLWKRSDGGDQSDPYSSEPLFFVNIPDSYDRLQKHDETIPVPIFHNAMYLITDEMECLRLEKSEDTISTADPANAHVPEPASMVLLGTGLILMSLALKKKVRRQQSRSRGLIQCPPTAVARFDPIAS